MSTLTTPFNVVEYQPKWSKHPLVFLTDRESFQKVKEVHAIYQHCLRRHATWVRWMRKTVGRLTSEPPVITQFAPCQLRATTLRGDKITCPDFEQGNLPECIAPLTLRRPGVPLRIPHVKLFTPPTVSDALERLELPEWTRAVVGHGQVPYTFVYAAGIPANMSYFVCVPQTLYDEGVCWLYRELRKPRALSHLGSPEFEKIARRVATLLPRILARHAEIVGGN